MSITVSTHLNFRGEAKAALELYRSVFGGDLTVFTYADAHDVQDPAEADQVKWGQVSSEDGFTVMAYDVPSSQPFARGEQSFFVSVRSDSAETIRTLWGRLAEGSTIVQDLTPAGWAPLYGMLTDRFGVTWVLDVAVAYSAS
ncbi:VOC family protein [Aeromicrobium wangtongii]|uniref:VOC family protein n=1 Tax=Aeromicrobium wangtongii TaxID=2969247 RepID=UPI0020182713|nr:VOC family protein [Aeromicrobium wangtongii]MCL3820053.1 VOC family protein [Aeromicrobium wangtongii]